MRTSVLPVARRSPLAPVIFAGNPKQFKTNWNPRARLESAERTHASPASAPPTGTWLLLGVEQRHTHKSDTGSDIYLSTQQPRALCRLVEELLRRDFLSFRNLNTTYDLILVVGFY